jgi:hypothetical protein
LPADLDDLAVADRVVERAPPDSIARLDYLEGDPRLLQSPSGRKAG